MSSGDIFVAEKPSVCHRSFLLCVLPTIHREGIYIDFPDGIGPCVLRSVSMRHADNFGFSA